MYLGKAIRLGRLSGGGLGTLLGLFDVGLAISSVASGPAGDGPLAWERAA